MLFGGVFKVSVKGLSEKTLKAMDPTDRVSRQNI
jgi:hypothetical protein